MTAYSALFSSGLLAPHTPRHSRPSSPLTPSSPVDPLLERTPARSRSSTISSVHSAASTSTAASTTTNATTHDRPRLRKRRSSLTPAAAPMPSIKSPTRCVRQSLLSPGRARSGSLAGAIEGNSLMGRMRSGSVGGPVSRARRVFARPTAPPPTVPLPPLPIIFMTGPSSAPASVHTEFPRSPLAHRAHTIDNGAPFLVTPDLKQAADMDVDGGYFTRIEEMKEN